MNYIRSCKNCTERYPACHDKCEKYLKEKRDYENYKKELHKKRLEDSSFIVKEGDFLGDSGHLRKGKYLGRHRKKIILTFY